MSPSFPPITLNSLDLNRAGYVYLIHAEGTNRYKVGRSKNPITRMADIQKQSPYKLVLVKSFFTPDSVSDEKTAHKCLNDFRVYGEWFEMPECWDYDSIRSFFWSGIAFQLKANGSKLLAETKIDTNDKLFNKNYLMFADKTILNAVSLDQFQVFDSFIKHLVQHIKNNAAMSEPNIITSYASGLILGACLTSAGNKTWIDWEETYL